MNLKYILAAGVVALLAGCDESRFLDTKLLLSAKTQKGINIPPEAL